MTETIEKDVVVDGAVGNEGERSSSTFSMAHGTPVGPLGPGPSIRTSPGLFAHWPLVHNNG